jgi:hypothetical protein
MANTSSRTLRPVAASDIATGQATSWPIASACPREPRRDVDRLPAGKLSVEARRGIEGVSTGAGAARRLVLDDDEARWLAGLRAAPRAR